MLWTLYFKYESRLNLPKIFSRPKVSSYQIKRRFGPAVCPHVAMVIASDKQQIYDSCFSLILGRDGRDAAEVGEKSLSS